MATAKRVKAKNTNKAEAAEAPADQSVGRNEPAREEIERRSYELYQARGAAHGYDLDDWLEAERELRDAQSSVLLRNRQCLASAK